MRIFVIPFLALASCSEEKAELNSGPREETLSLPGPAPSSTPMAEAPIVRQTITQFNADDSEPAREKDTIDPALITFRSLRRQTIDLWEPLSKLLTKVEQAKFEGDLALAQEKFLNSFQVDCPDPPLLEEHLQKVLDRQDDIARRLKVMTDAEEDEEEQAHLQRLLDDGKSGMQELLDHDAAEIEELKKKIEEAKRLLAAE